MPSPGQSLASSSTRALRQEPGRASARDRLVDTAVARIRREGMSVGLDHISLERVIADSGVSRATAYRHWPLKADFLREVLVTTVRTTRLDEGTPEEITELAGWVAARREALGTESGRRTVVVEGLRRSADADFRRVLRSPGWQTYVAIAATCRGLPEGRLRNDVERALAQTEEAFTLRRAGVYARLSDVLGYRLMPHLAAPAGFEIMARAAGAMLTGSIVAATARPEAVTQAVPMAAFGSTEVADWTTPAHQLVGVVLAHIEPDPGVRWDRARREAVVGRLEELLATLDADPDRS